MEKRRLTVEGNHNMGEAGIFREDDRVGLIAGEVVEAAAIKSTVSNLTCDAGEALPPEA